MSRICFIFSVAVFLIVGVPNTADAKGQEYKCPTASAAKSMFDSEESKTWPNYTEAAALRVQMQHPDTKIIAAHSKYLDRNGYQVAICQYYTHIGLLMTTAFRVVGKGEIEPQSFWRIEYQESNEKDDKLGEEFVEVCMKREGELATPSVGCSFVLPTED